MRPIVRTFTAPGFQNSTPIGFDYFKGPFNVSTGCSVTGTVTYTIQHTFDDIQASTYSSATGNWFNHDDSTLNSATASQNGNFAFPCTAARVQTATGSTGNLVVTFTQAG